MYVTTARVRFASDTPPACCSTVVSCCLELVAWPTSSVLPTVALTPASQVDSIMSGRSYKEVVAGTEFDTLDPATENEIEEACRRMSALQENSLEEYLLEKG